MRPTREGGFTVLELILAIAVAGVLAGVGLTAYGSFQERTHKAKAAVAWQELSAAVHRYRLEHGRWPTAHSGVEDLKLAMPPEGPLLFNLAPNGPTAENPTGYLILNGGKVCVWVEGTAAARNDPQCP